MFVARVRHTTPEPQIIPDTPVPYAELEKKNVKINRFKNFFVVLNRCYVVYFRNSQDIKSKILQTIGFILFAIILFRKPTDPAYNTAQATSDVLGLAFFVSSV